MYLGYVVSGCFANEVKHHWSFFCHRRLNLLSILKGRKKFLFGGATATAAWRTPNLSDGRMQLNTLTERTY